MVLLGLALEGGPALGEQGESSFSLAAEAAEQAVSGSMSGPGGRGSMTGWPLAPGRCAFPEYQASMSSPFAMVAVSARRSVSEILPSRMP